jgi:hypothetical protein
MRPGVMINSSGSGSGIKIVVIDTWRWEKNKLVAPLHQIEDGDRPLEEGGQSPR